MKYIVLAVLLTVMQASPPVPRKATDPSNRTAQNVAKEPGSDKAPTQQTPTVVHSITTAPDKNGSHGPGAEDTQKPTTISELPPVSVTKDRWDRIYIIFTGILMVVGIFGVYAAYKTLGEIKAQREAMQGQLTTMHGQLTQMESTVKQTDRLIEKTGIAADAAKVSADIAARVSIPTLVVEKFGFGYTGSASMAAILQYPNVEVVIKNYGQTPAFLRSWTIIFTCEELPEISVYADYPGSGIVLEKEVVKPGEAYTLPKLEMFKRQNFSDDDIKAILNREKLFIAYGYICYGDLFGNALKRHKFCEIVLNIGDTWAQWTELFSDPPYIGTDDLPIKRPSSGQGKGSTSRTNTQAEDNTKKEN
jgi:hypothetical protein